MADDRTTPTEAQLLAKLRRATKPKTAKDLGAPAARIKNLPGVVVVGTLNTGKAGRPALLFMLNEAEQARQGTGNQVTITNDADDEVEPEGRS